jgi:hypothetical protein
MGSLYKLEGANHRGFTYWSCSADGSGCDIPSDSELVNFLNQVWPSTSKITGSGTNHDYATLQVVRQDSSTIEGKLTLTTRTFKRRDMSNSASSWGYVQESE